MGKEERYRRCVSLDADTYTEMDELLDEASEGIFCPECGTKYEKTEEDIVIEKQIEEEKKREAEELARLEKEEAERKEREKLEQQKKREEDERLAKEQAEIKARTYKGVVYNTIEEKKQVKRVSAANGFAITSLVLGIISIPLMCLYCTGIITVIISIVFGILALVQKAKIKGVAIAGIVTAVMAVVIPVVLGIVLQMTLGGGFGSSSSSSENSIEQENEEQSREITSSDSIVVENEDISEAIIDDVGNDLNDVEDYNEVSVDNPIELVYGIYDMKIDDYYYAEVEVGYASGPDCDYVYLMNMSDDRMIEMKEFYIYDDMKEDGTYVAVGDDGYKVYIKFYENSISVETSDFPNYEGEYELISKTDMDQVG